MTFNAAAAKALFAAVESHAQALGIFDRVNTHEPLNKPGKGLSASIVLAGIAPDPRTSGQASVSGIVTLLIRVYKPMTTRPLDPVDPEILGAAATLLAAYAGDFTLGGTVRDVDPLALRAQPRYLQQDGEEFRVVEVTLPIGINDMWPEVA